MTPYPTMKHHLTRDLEYLKEQILAIGSRVELSVRNAITSLESGDQHLAQEVIEGDIEIDRAEVEFEENLLKTMALHQPVATDLRFLAACFKINNDLERIGDLAKNIAERVYEDEEGPASNPHLVKDLRVMADASFSMLRRSLESFVSSDSAMARKVIEDDQFVDDKYGEFWAGVINGIKTFPSSIDANLHLLSTARNLERIADLATNIGEDVVYMVDGEIIRHETKLKNA